MKTVQFLSNSTQIKNIIKGGKVGLTLSKSLFVSILIVGEPHTGNKNIIKSLFGEQKFIDGRDIKEVHRALENSKEVILYNFDAIDHIENLNLKTKEL